MTQYQNLAWTDKYSPKAIEDLALPKDITDRLHPICRGENLLSLLLHGLPGTGKSSTARLICSEDALKLNAGLTRPTFLKDIEVYCSTTSMSGDRKVVLIDEVDGLTKGEQAKLRAIMDKFSTLAMFVFTTNHPEKLLPALISRVVSIDFNFAKGDSALQMQMVNRVRHILAQENIPFEDAQVMSIVKAGMPDMRSILSTLQSSCLTRKVA